MKIKRLIGGSLESNGYIIYNAEGGNCYVIDPGYDGKRYIGELDKMKLKILGILLTHHHYDHVDAVMDIVNRYGCPVYLHAEDCDMYGKNVDVKLDDGDILKLDDQEIQVLHTPGHTKGGVCYYNDRHKVAFTGDTIFNVDLGRTDLKDGSPKQMENTIRNVISQWTDDTTIYPGHGDPATMKYVKNNNREYMDLVR